MPSNAALIEKLEQAPEGSRKLDALIHIALHDPDIMTDTGGYRGERPVKYQKASTVFTETWPDWDGAALAMDAPHYTTNLKDTIDAVTVECSYIELHIELPMDGCDTMCMAQIRIDNEIRHVGTSATAALALSAANVKAREADGG